MLSCDNMSGGLVHCMESFEIYDDGSQEVPTSVNVRSAPSIPKARVAGGHGETTQNEYVNFFSLMDKKSDISMGLNEVVVPKTKQGSYGSKD